MRGRHKKFDLTDVDLRLQTLLALNHDDDGFYSVLKCLQDFSGFSISLRLFCRLQQVQEFTLFARRQKLGVVSKSFFSKQYCLFSVHSKSICPDFLIELSLIWRKGRQSLSLIVSTYLLNSISLSNPRRNEKFKFAISESNMITIF